MVADGLELLSRQFLARHPEEAAAAITRLPEASVALLLSQQPTDVLLRIWRHLPAEKADALLPALSSDARQAFLVTIDPADSVNILNRLPANEKQACIEQLPVAVARELETLASYPVGTAGRIMDSRVIGFQPNDAVASVRRRLRQDSDKRLRQIFVVDAERKLDFMVDIHDIAVASDNQTLSDLARPVRAVVSPFDSRETVAEKLQQFNLEVLPVVDVNQRLIGVIRHSALLMTLQEQSVADLQTMVGAGRDERALSTPLFAVRKRLPWMEINLLTAFLAAAVVGLFENTIAQFTALAVLLPVVAGQSGNAGAQAQAVTMRGLALREITARHTWRLVFKEARIGLVNGVVIALTTAAGVYVWSRSAGLALVIGISMVISMVAAGVAGALVPVTLSRLGQDPAQSSSIILTTVTDIAGFMSFLGIATLLSALL